MFNLVVALMEVNYEQQSLAVQCLIVGCLNDALK